MREFWVVSVIILEPTLVGIFSPIFYSPALIVHDLGIIRHSLRIPKDSF